MTRVKLCGLSSLQDIEAANELLPNYVGFVFALQSKRYISPAQAAKLKEALSKKILAVGVFVDEDIQAVAELLTSGTVDIAQLHGGEDEEYVKRLKALTGKPVIKAVKVSGAESIRLANISPADYVLLDSGAGGGTAFDWELLQEVRRPYFLAGGLNIYNIYDALKYSPFAVDVSSGIESGGKKDKNKMAAFVAAVRNYRGGNTNE